MDMGATASFFKSYETACFMKNILFVDRIIYGFTPKLGNSKGPSSTISKMREDEIDFCY